MRVLGYELAIALRRLWRRPVPSGLMLATFTVSIGLCLLSWSLFHTIFLRNPEFDPKGELCLVTYVDSHWGSNWKQSTRLDIEAWQAGQTVFRDFTAVMLYHSVIIELDDGTERTLGANLSAASLRLVGAQPLLGRLFTADEDKIGCAPVVILSHHMWQDRFSGDAKIIGRTLRVSGTAATIVGVMPADFRFPNDQDIWLPLGFDADYKGYPMLDILARLKPGISPERAADDLRVILARRGQDSPANQAGYVPFVMPFREFYLNHDIQVSALVLFVLSLLFVAVSCSNAANLMMIDFFGRAPELATSYALGLPRRAAIRGVIFQVAIVGIVAAAVSLGALGLTAPILHQQLRMMNAPYWLIFNFQAHHVLVAIGLAVICGAAAAIVPIAYLFLSNPEAIIRDGAGASRGTGRAVWRRSLLAAQIALLTVLGISAGLLVRSSYHVSEGRWGYDARSVFMGKLAVRGQDYPTAEKRLALLHNILDELRRIPGMHAAAFMAKPLGYSGPGNCSYALEAATLDNHQTDGSATYSEVTEDIFATLEVPLVAGSTIPRQVLADGPTYAVINQSLAAKLWPGQDPLNRAFFVRYSWMEPKEPTARLIVCGVVRDFQAGGPMSRDNDAVYIPFGTWVPLGIFLLARGETGLPSGNSIRDAVHRVDPRLALYFPDSLAHQIDLTLASVHLTTRLTTLFALAAVLLCAVGVYSLTVSQILQRYREFGIRLALGVEPFQLWLRFARGHLLTVTLGVAIGLGAAMAAVRVLRSLLFGVQAHDPATFAGVAACILVVSALACIPSLFRLQRIKPAECLRTL